MTIAIVGGGGFLGQQVAARVLAHGLRPLVIHRGLTPTQLPEGALVAHADRADGERLADLFARHEVTAVVDIFALTLASSLPVMHATALQGARYVLTSSIDVYTNYAGLIGKEAPPVRPEPATEDAPLRSFRYPYRGDTRRPQGADHALLDDYDKLPIEEAALADGRMQAVIIRPPMIFGRGDRQNRFAWITRAAQRGTPFAIDARAAGWENSYAHVGDVAEALVLAATAPQAAGRIYNIGQAHVRTAAQWARRILDLMGHDDPVVCVPPEARGAMAERADGMDMRYPLTLDSRRIRAELGFAELVDEDTALREAIAYEMGRVA